ncbi:hypothetical protein AB0J01_37905 [Streptomyces sp. NPDC050204]|uniref:hypothetical protein n=1 Tax=Streptomyces sp. NPDC050204 TaxID=3155514 RepID=UPI003436838D
MPYIALTAGEQRLHVPELVIGADGWIEYRDPTPFDRYPYSEVLLTRTVGSVPSGQPDGATLSPYRQAHCMINLLCQGCAAPAAISPEGWRLWVLRATSRTGGPAATTGYTDMPPSCARCALHWCPVLNKVGRKLLWVPEAELAGVYGTLFPPVTGQVMQEKLVLLDNELELSATVTTRFVRNLQRVRKADPADIAELARRQPAPARPGPVPDLPAPIAAGLQVLGRTR